MSVRLSRASGPSWERRINDKPLASRKACSQDIGQSTHDACHVSLTPICCLELFFLWCCELDSMQGSAVCLRLVRVSFMACSSPVLCQVQRPAPPLVRHSVSVLAQQWDLTRGRPLLPLMCLHLHTHTHTHTHTHATNIEPDVHRCVPYIHRRCCPRAVASVSSRVCACHTHHQGPVLPWAQHAACPACLVQARRAARRAHVSSSVSPHPLTNSLLTLHPWTTPVSPQP